MNDPSIVPSALGIEAVEWIAEGGENVTVRVTGRWRRRRPDWSGKPTLVVEAPGRRYRFPAMPEPPSLSGVGPGTWRITFSVPSALAHDLGGRAWLQFGSVSVPLPAAVQPLAFDEPSDESGAAPAVSRAALGEVEAVAETEVAGASAEASGPPSSPGPPAATASPPPTPRALAAIRRAEEAEAAVEALAGVVRDLERDLASARTRADDLAVSLAGQERDRRGAEQRAHAERELRLDLARELAGHRHEAQSAREAFGQLAAAEAHVRELETQLDAARRRIDEAEQAAAAATAARTRAREALEAEQRHRAQESAESHSRLAAQEAARLQMELGLERARGATAERAPSEPPMPVIAHAVVPPATRRPAAPPSGPPAAEPGAEALVAALRIELDARAGAEASLRARAVDAEARLAAREQLGRRTGEALEHLRSELDGLRADLSSERDGRLAAERRRDELERALGTSRTRSRDALTAISDLREVLAGLAPPPPPPSPDAQAPPRAEVEPERLNAALARLRERTPAPEAAGPVPDEGSVSGEGSAPDEGPAATPAAVPAPTVAVRDATSDPAPAGSPPAEPTTRDWLGTVFRALVAVDADRAGRLLTGLLPALPAVHTAPVAFDLVLAGREQATRVTASDGAVAVAEGEPRPLAEVDFRAAGDHAALARMIVAGPLRRRLGWGVARLYGRRSEVAALEALAAARINLAALSELGVRLDGRTALSVVAMAIDPALTVRESFTLAYAPDGEEETYLVVHAGAPLAVTGKRPAGRIAVTITGSTGTLERILGGTGADDPAVSGDPWPLAVLRKWLAQAQNG